MSHLAEPTTLIRGATALPDGSVAVNRPWSAVLCERGPDYSAGVDVRVRFDGPGGARIEGCAFWDGDGVWRIARSFPVAGTWQWQTSATPAQPAVHGRSGTVTVVDVPEENPLYRHGPLRVAEGGRFLEHRDGRPFLWLGDTAWTSPSQASADDWRRYVADRARKGYTVVQVATASNGLTNRSGVPPFDGPGVGRIVPAYWRHLADMSEITNAHGLVLWVNGLGDPLWDHKPYPQQELDRLAIQVVARLSGYQVIFSPNSDSDAGLATGPAIANASSAHLIHTHPGTYLWPERLYDAGWNHANGLQTGHHGGNRRRQRAATFDWTAQVRAYRPRKPLINVEAFYDAGGTTAGMLPKFQGTAHDARALAYISCLSGAAGYTCGAFGLWNWESDPDKPWHWERAIGFASSAHMSVFAAVMRLIGCWRFEPAHHRVQAPGTDVLLRCACAVRDDRQILVAYIPESEIRSVTVDTADLPSPWQAWWIDPVGGWTQPAAPEPRSGSSVAFVRPPGPRDHLLFLAAMDACAVPDRLGTVFAEDPPPVEAVEPAGVVPPRAKAGPDQSLSVSDSTRIVVKLDGSGSVPGRPKGVLVSYLWIADGREIARGVRPEVRLPVGTHRIALVVQDDDGLCAESVVTVRVD
jgi:hypothetical protein